MPQPLTPWTPERVIVLLHLWEMKGTTGETAETIAARLGGTSRSAVLGKLKRMGKLGNRPPRRKSPKPAEHRLPLLRKPSRPIAPVHLTQEPEPLVFSVLDLREGHCRWPIGDPGEPGFGFCGHPAPDSYCDHHHRTAYQPQ